MSEHIACARLQVPTIDTENEPGKASKQGQFTSKTAMLLPVGKDVGADTRNSDQDAGTARPKDLLNGCKSRHDGVIRDPMINCPATEIWSFKHEIYCRLADMFAKFFRRKASQRTTDDLHV